MHEQPFRLARLTGDVDELDALIDDDAVFVNHFGMTMTKADDLAVYRQKLFTLERLDYVEQEIRDLGGMVATVTLEKLAGVWDGPFAEKMTYARVWRTFGDGRWKVVASQSTRNADR